MGYDPDGTFNWKNLLAAITIAAVTLLCVITAGVAAVAITGSVAVGTSIASATAIGCAISAGTTIVDSAIKNGCEDIDFLDLICDTFAGGIHGALSATLAETAENFV